MFFCIVLLLHF
jgi:hypothetical protein